MITLVLFATLALAQERRPADEPPADALRVPGRVVLPAGTPKDEALVVVVRSSVRFDQPQDEDPRERRVEVDEEGRFTAVFAPRSKRGWVELEGQHLFLERRARVALEPLPEELELRPLLGGRLRVQLTPPADHTWPAAPFEGARVVAGEGFDESGPRHDLAPDATGVGEAGPIRPSPRWELRAEVPGFVDLERDGLAVTAGALGELELRLVPEVRLEGRVVDPDGAPVAGAWLFASVEGDGPGGHGRATAGEDGAFSVGGLRAGPTTLQVRTGGFLPESSALGTLAPGEVRAGLVVELDRGLSIAGTVRRPDGRPAAGAAVKALPGHPAPDTSMQSAVADEEGRFELTGLVAGSYELEALAADESAAASAADVAAGARGVALVLERPTALVGRVVDEDDFPVTAFTLVAEPAPGTPGEARRLALEHPTGRFELEGLEPGTWRVRAEVEGCATLGAPRVRLPGRTTPLELRVMRLATLRGVVLAPTGDPAPRARVALRGDPRGRVYVTGAGPPEARADAEGRFELREVPPGFWYLVASARGSAGSEPLELSLATGEVRVGLRVALRRGARITGEVRPSVQDRARRTVMALPGDVQAGLSSAPVGARTDREGRFELKDLTPGRYAVGLLDGDTSGLEHSAEVELSAGEELRLVLGGPSPEAVLLSGRVLDDEGPRAGLRLDFQRLGGWSPPRPTTTESDAEGRYELTLDHPGAYLVSLRDGSDDLGELELDVPAAASAARDLLLDAGTIEGVLRDEVGRALPGLSVQLEREDAPPRVVTSAMFASVAMRAEVTDAEGRFALEHLPAGTYTLRAGGRTGRGAPPESAGHAQRSLFGLRLEEGQRLELALELPRAATLAGRVLGAGGHAPPDAMVQVCDELGRALTPRPVRADPTGRFRVEHLAPGRVRARAMQGGRPGPWVELELRAGVREVLVLRLGG